MDPLWNVFIRQQERHQLRSGRNKGVEEVGHYSAAAGEFLIDSRIYSTMNEQKILDDIFDESIDNVRDALKNNNRA
jgi:hypothetical protein